jgi:hypothetical protein
MRKLHVVTTIGTLALAVPLFAGVTYTAKTTSEGGRGAAHANAVVKAWVSGDKAKIEFEESGNPMERKGMYIVTSDGGKTMYMVNPQDKKYFKWDMEGMMGMAGGMMKMMHLKFSNPKVEELGSEPGGVILGMPTTHYKYRTSYTMEMSMAMMHRKTSTVNEQDIWTTSKLADPGLGVWLRKTPPKFNNEELDNLVKAEMGKMKGFPLKTVSKITNTDEKGRTEVTTTTMEVTELESASVPDSTFAIPAGYEEAAMPGMGPMGGERQTNHE